jgi:hypothetical protein
MRPGEGCVWNAVDREWLLTVEDEAPLVSDAVAAPPSEHAPQRDPERYDGAYAAHGPDRSRASVQPYTRECMVDFDCGGCGCGFVMAPCRHCMEHWTEDQP